MRFSKSAVILAALFFVSACGGSGGIGAVGCAFDFGREMAPPRIVLNTQADRATIDVVDVPDAQLAGLRAIDSREAWAHVFRVAVAADQPPMLGEYTIDGRGVRFTPMFPLDPGRQYY